MPISTAGVTYTCALGGHDWIHKPVVTTPGMAYLRFSDRPGWRQAPWQHRSIDVRSAHSRRLVARRAKILGHTLLPDIDLAVWVDSSVLILADITPLLKEFEASGAEIGLFRHPSGRTTAEELDFALEVGRVDAPDRADAQRERYAERGLLNVPVHETTILFRRLRAPRLQAAMLRWWHEVSTYTERDQVSLAWALDEQGCAVHEWDWHFADPGCPWFRRIPHRPLALAKRILTGAHFLGDYRTDYRVARSAIAAAARVRRRLRRAP